MPIEFTIPIQALSLQSSGKRMVIRNGRPVFFKNKRASDYHKLICAYVARYLPKSPFSVPMHVSVEFHLPRPARLNGKKHFDGIIPHDRRPDLDNLQKSLQDALYGFWNDDAQIASLSLRKFFAAKNQRPHINIQINPIAQNEPC
jgi:Holliday junction resolvase RusA-like endonuclease